VAFRGARDRFGGRARERQRRRARERQRRRARERQRQAVGAVGRAVLGNRFGYVR
jgi:hypothetical protein